MHWTFKCIVFPLSCLLSFFSPLAETRSLSNLAFQGILVELDLVVESSSPQQAVAQQLRWFPGEIKMLWIRISTNGCSSFPARWNEIRTGRQDHFRTSPRIFPPGKIKLSGSYYLVLPIQVSTTKQIMVFLCIMPCTGMVKCFGQKKVWKSTKSYEGNLSTSRN